MFNLIITIISIALVAVLAIATIYYGGSTFSNQGKEVDTAKLLNSSAHLKAAIELYRADHQDTSPSNLGTDLIPHYLRAIPEGATDNWQIVSGFVVTTLGPSSTTGGATPEEISAARAACEAVNVKLGIPAPVPLCSAVDTNIQVCCETLD